jgi:HK97 family phage major capsid protein
MSDFEQKHIEALSAIRDETKKLSPEQEAKINSLLDLQEAKNQAKFKEIIEKSKKIEELENRYNALEADLKRGLGGEEKQAKTQELKSFEQLLLKGNLAIIGTEERKYLQERNNEQGGYLAPAEYANEIIKKITEVSPVRSVARIIPTNAKEIKFAKRSGLVSGGWVGEAQTSTQSNSTYGEDTIKAEKMQVYTDISFELFRDSAFDMKTQIISDISEDFSRLEGQAFISGNGVNKPEGLLTNSSVGETVTGSASALTGDSLYTIQGFIPTGYNLAWMFNRKTLHGNIRTLKDTYGQYLFVPSLGSSDMPNTVAGLPYYLANDMPDVGAGTYPIIVGDYRKCYYIVDNQSVEFLEDPYTQATNGKRRFIVYKRTGGQVVLPEGLRKLKVSA